MKMSLEINGKKLLPIKHVVESVSYSRDYITRLAREGKIVATHIGRNWYVDIDSLKNYESVSKDEQVIRKRRLSEERKRDLRIKELKKTKTTARVIKINKAKVPAAAFASLVVAGGLLSGFLLEGILLDEVGQSQQLASVSTQGSEVVDIENVNNEVSYVSTESENEIVSVDFIHEVNKESFASTDSGVLILPTSQNKDMNPSELFSDEVIVAKNNLGETVLVQVNAKGVPYGVEIPFVAIPVNHSIQ